MCTHLPEAELYRQPSDRYHRYRVAVVVRAEQLVLVGDGPVEFAGGADAGLGLGRTVVFGSWQIS